MSPYIFGTKSAATRTLQRALASGGFYAGPIDGIFGRLTSAGVDAARKQFGLSPGGVDAALLKALSPPARDPFGGLLGALARTVFFSQLKGLIAMTFLSGYKTYIIAGAMLIAGTPASSASISRASPAKRRATS